MPELRNEAANIDPVVQFATCKCNWLEGAVTAVNDSNKYNLNQEHLAQPVYSAAIRRILTDRPQSALKIREDREEHVTLGLLPLHPIAPNRNARTFLN